jgi:hypothetical protein
VALSSASGSKFSLKLAQADALLEPSSPILTHGLEFDIGAPRVLETYAR